MPDGGRHLASIRNLVLLNPVADGLGFAAASFGRCARVVRIEEFGPHLSVATMVPSTPDMRVLLPRPVAFSGSEEGLTASLAGLAPPRVLVAHTVGEVDRLERLNRMVGFDAACIGPEIDPEEARDALSPLIQVPEIGIPGLDGVRFFGNPVGARALDLALADIDAARRRRRRVRAQVYDIGDLALQSGFYPIERDREWAWAWTGPETIATLLVPSHGESRTLYTLFFFSTKFRLDPGHLRVLVNGQETRCAYFADENKVEVPSVCPDALCTRIDLVQTEIVPTADHSRFIGLALHKLKVELEP